MSYYPCITYIKDGNFHHIKIKAQYTEEETAFEIRVNIRRYKLNQFLIELDTNKGHDYIGKNFYINRYIVYNSSTHQAEEIVDPLKALIDLKPYLEQLGYPIPKRYLRKIKNGTPFNWLNSAPVTREYWDVNNYMDENDLEILL